MAAIKGEQSIVVQAPAEEVYAYISDFPRHVEWNHQPMEMTKLTGGPVGVGSVFRTQEQSTSNTPWFLAKVFTPILFAIIGQKAYTEAEISAMEPARRLAWKARAPIRNGDLMQADYEIALEPQGEATKVIERYDLRLLLKFMDRMTGEPSNRLFAEEVYKNLERLKATLEGATGAG